MLTAAVMTFVYGAFSIIGGIIGFRQAGSKPSLISGLITGVLLLIAGVGITSGQLWGVWLAIAVTALLVVVFIFRLIKTRRFMPAGLMTTVGIITLIVLLTALA